MSQEFKIVSIKRRFWNWRAGELVGDHHNS